MEWKDDERERIREKKANGIACVEPTQANYRIDAKWIKCWIAYSRAAGAKNANQLNAERSLFDSVFICPHKHIHHLAEEFILLLAHFHIVIIHIITVSIAKHFMWISSKEIPFREKEKLERILRFSRYLLLFWLRWFFNNKNNQPENSRSLNILSIAAIKKEKTKQKTDE